MFVCLRRLPPCAASGNTRSTLSVTPSWFTMPRGASCGATSDCVNCWAANARLWSVGVLLSFFLSKTRPTRFARIARELPARETIQTRGFGYFLASNSSFADPSGRVLGTVHVLKDITERKRAEEKYRTLVSNVQEGVFISTPQGRFLDFNDALLRMSGYESRDELMAIDIPGAFYKILPTGSDSSDS